jgi:hypothetical protein
MERPIEKHRAADRWGIVVKSPPASPFPTEGQCSVDGGSGAIPKCQFHRLKHPAKLAEQEIHISSPSSLVSQTIPADHHLSTAALIRFAIARCRERHGNDIFSIVKCSARSVSLTARYLLAVGSSTPGLGSGFG